MDTKTLSPSNSGRRTTTRTSACASPEFEFWMVRNPSFPQPNILSADELIVDGVLLPLHLLNKPDPPPPPPITDSVAATASASKRWKDIFRKSDKKNADLEESESKGKKKEKKNAVTTSAPELNVNIWPFSRSRSAVNAGTRPKLFTPSVTRKANSAPCSRSNSAGESKSRKWPSSPGRAGVHLGRSSPVWQVRRAKIPEPLPLNNPDKSKRETRRSKLAGGCSAQTRVLNMNVPMCIGYKHHLSCRSDDNSASNCNPAQTHANVGGKLFTLRSLFTKKSVVTSH